MFKHSLKTWSFVALIALIAIGAIAMTLFSSNVAKAGASHNVVGFAWSDMPDGSDEVLQGAGPNGRGAGWISMNSNGLLANGAPSGYSSAVDYGVNINTATGAVSGYAWSEHMGWIDFSGVTMNTTTGLLSGFARAIAGGTAQSGGWDGQISMSGTTQRGGSYGVIVNLPTNPLAGFGTSLSMSGYAWGDMVMGWIDFSRVAVQTTLTPEPLPTCGDGLVHVSLGEQCDDGNLLNGDGCSSVCALENPQLCPNGTIDPGETCDDNNRIDGDGCSSTCQDESRMPEPPDGPNTNSDLCPNISGNQNQLYLDDNKLIIDPSTGNCVQDVDDLCQNEAVWPGVQNVIPVGQMQVGNKFCVPELTCGNGTIDPGEQCDDGNTISGDGCSSTCVNETSLPPSVIIPIFQET